MGGQRRKAAEDKAADQAVKKLRDGAKKIVSNKVAEEQGEGGEDASTQLEQEEEEIPLAQAFPPAKDEGTPKTETLVMKTDRSHFIVAAKRSKDPNLQAAYQEYMSLDRFDERKSSIISLWKKDKSCTWWNSWKREQSEQDLFEKDAYAGYGTMHPCLR
jgi:hypothetical protein